MQQWKAIIDVLYLPTPILVFMNLIYVQVLAPSCKEIPGCF